jgi:hypothetical protein
MNGKEISGRRREIKEKSVQVTLRKAAVLKKTRQNDHNSSEKRKVILPCQFDKNTREHWRTTLF